MSLIHPWFAEKRSIFKRPVWQITTPSDYRDRMVNENAPAIPPEGYPLTNHGGSVLATPKLAIVYLGQWWGDTTKLESFANDLMEAGYLEPLVAYGSGQGTFLGGFSAPTQVPSTITDAQIQSALFSLIQANPFGGSLPMPDGNTLYAICLPEGVTVSDSGASSCSDFCGYHDALPDGKTFYSVHPATNCNGCNLGNAFDAFTMVLGHEVAEACTDAIPGGGWYSDQTGMENADEWAWIPGSYGPWTVQGYELNNIGNSLQVIQYNPSTNPQPQPNIQQAIQDLQAAQKNIQSALGALND